MNETQLPGMQGLARERVEAAVRRYAPSISRIADQRMTDMRHMHADLVRAPSRSSHSTKLRGQSAPENPIAGQRLAPTRHNRHFVRWTGCRPIGAFTSPPNAGSPCTRAR